MLEFPNLTEEQIDKMGLAAKGRYKGVVVKADQDTSKSGHPQIKLSIRIIDQNEMPIFITHYLSTNGQYMMRMLRHFCNASGLENKYESKRLFPGDCLNRTFLCDIDVQEGSEKFDMQGQPNGKWPDKNIITDFIKDESANNEFKDDPIPF